MWGVSAHAETRLALVIDQVGYSGNLSPLPGARQEADQVAASLQKTGFQITRVHSATRPQLDTAFRDFRRQVSANPGAVVFIYYTGHGIRDAGSDTNDNYLLGVEADISVASDLTAYGVQLQNLTDQFAQTGAAAVIFVLDACRTTPTLGKAGTKGLIPISVAANTLVAYSTGAGDVADVGVYAPVLAEEILKPGQDVIQLFSSVQKKVASKTNRKQLPWSNNLIYNDVCLVSCTEQMAGPVPQPAGPSAWEIEKAVWDRSRDCPDFEAYLAQYPSGAFVTQARQRLGAGCRIEKKTSPARTPEAALEEGLKANDAADYDISRPLFEQACDGGVAKGCFYLAWMVDSGLGGLTQDYARARSLYDRACTGKDAQACGRLGLYYYFGGSGLGRDYARSKTYYEMGCTYGDMWSCNGVGLLYYNGYGVTANIPESVHWFETACGGNAYVACHYLGSMYESGTGKPQNYAKARSFYEKACTQTYAKSCEQLAATFYYGRGGTDLNLARTYYEQACNGKEAAACGMLGSIYQSGEGVPKDMVKARIYFETACAGNSGVSCDQAGQFHEDGIGTAKNMDKARVLFEKGCKLGYSHACERADRMKPAS
ncbi:caspase family protein [Asticcacaulis sp. BYS171W]|uniref:Caspase family protein n=1 Tax=Asticcacaulis aquaticus TaxID=2984212 RepID=A0ABT5HUT0_9CAUL|nr:caspase family protein [Asticcacaulis aquaticus]MDC7683211.1 caspase family protein [Asticcacaulis aquaticus]